MANPVLLARAAAVLTDESARKAVGWIIVAVLSPIILLIAFLCALASGTAAHNVSAAELCFYGGELPADTPEEYRTYIEDMESSQRADDRDRFAVGAPLSAGRDSGVLSRDFRNGAGR